MLAPSWYPSSRQLRQFAAAALFASALIGFGIWRSGGTPRAFLFATLVGAAVCLAGMLSPRTVRPLYVLLMAVTLPLGWLVSNLLLVAIYFALITPIAWIFRLAGRDQLTMRRKAVDSYWRPYRSSKNVGSYFRQA